MRPGTDVAYAGLQSPFPTQSKARGQYGDAMGLLNRSNNTWYSPTIVSAIMNGNK
jgi:hypothetical protein